MSGSPQRQGPLDSLGDAMKRIRVLERLVPSAGGSWPWGLAAINGFYSVPSATPTEFGIDDGALTTSTDDGSIFAAEEFAPGQFGLKIGAPGIYAFFWTVNYNDVFGHRVASPETFIAEAADGSGSTGTFVIAPALFSYFNRGYLNTLDGVTATWDVGWISIWATDGTDAGVPFVISGKQSTGETLHAYTSIWAIQFSPTTHGWT